MLIKDPELDKVIEQIEKFESRLYAHPLHEKEDVDDVYNLYLEKDKVSYWIFFFLMRINYFKLFVLKNKTIRLTGNF